MAESEGRGAVTVTRACGRMTPGGARPTLPASKRQASRRDPSIALAPADSGVRVNILRSGPMSEQTEGEDWATKNGTAGVNWHD